MERSSPSGAAPAPAAARVLGSSDYRWDVFVSHATEDKQEFVAPLCEALRQAGLRVWVDFEQLELGDRLGSDIDEGLLRSHFCLVVFSPEFMRKGWTLSELEGAAVIERQRGSKYLLPLWHRIGIEELAQRLPRLAERRGLSSRDGIPAIVRQIRDVIQSDLAGGMPDPLSTITFEDVETTRRRALGESPRVPTDEEVLDLLRLVTDEDAREEARRAILKIGWACIGDVVVRNAEGCRDEELEVSRLALAAFRADAEILHILNQVIRSTDGATKRDFVELRNRKRLELDEDHLARLHEGGWPYRVDRVLGQGLHTQTYRAIDTRVELPVTLRILRPEHVRDDHMPRAYLSTALEARRYMHTNLLSPQEAYRLKPSPTDRTLYYVLRNYCEGPSLKTALASEGRLPWTQVTTAVVDVVRALQPLHAAGRAHGGIKPSNVFLREAGGALLADPSLPIQRTAGAAGPASYDYMYAAPELLERDSEATPACDFYSLGCLLYECLSGRACHLTDDLLSLVAWHARGEPIDFDELPSDAPRGLRELLEDLLRRDPDQRLTDRERLLERLADLRTDVDQTLPPPVSLSPTATRTMLTLAAPGGDAPWEALLAQARRAARSSEVPAEVRSAHSGAGPASPPPPPASPAQAPVGAPAPAPDETVFGIESPGAGASPPPPSPTMAAGDGHDTGVAYEAGTAVTSPTLNVGQWHGRGPIDFDAGTLLGEHYRIERCIGQGGFGSVYSATNLLLEAPVAIKVMHPELARDRARLEQFLGEARRLMSLNHPNIVQWHTLDRTEDGLYFIVMEMLEGEELEAVLRRDGALPPARAVPLMRQTLEALRFVHELPAGEQLLHLDIKPHNLMLVRGADAKEQVKLIDFGISMLQVQSEGIGRVRSGTPAYTSPEQAAHLVGRDDVRALDPRSDLFSFGITAFRMLSGRLPQESRNAIEMLDMRLHRPAPSLASAAPNLPTPLVRFVDRCLAVNREDRWQSASEALRALDQAKSSSWMRGLRALLKRS